MESKQLKVTLVKSMIGCKKNQIAVLYALGLRKIRQSRLHSDSPAIRGMIEKVSHMLTVEEA